MGILKKTSFLLVVTNLCWNAVQSWSKPTILDKLQSIKDNWKTKMNNIVQLGCLFSKLMRLFVDFPSTNGSIFYRSDELRSSWLKSLNSFLSCWSITFRLREMLFTCYQRLPIFLEGMLFLACLFCFILLMMDIWDKYYEQKTSTGELIMIYKIL